MDPLFGSILDTAAQQSTAFAQQGIDAQLNKKQREWMERREDLQYQRGWDVMNYQNWYNSPEQQMTRFRQAGLNPHLIYGRGTPGNTQSTPQMGNRGKYNNQVSKLHMPQMMATYQQMRINEAQTDLLNKQTALTEAKKLTETINQFAKWQDGRRKKVLADYQQQVTEADIAKTVSEMKKNLAHLTLIDSQKLVNQARASYIKESEKYLPDTGSVWSIGMRNAKQGLRWLWDNSKGSIQRNYIETAGENWRKLFD